MEPLHYLLMRAHGAVNREILDGAAKLGLTPGQPKILEFLTNNGESDQKTLAAECEIEQATAGGILLRMEQAGLIERKHREGNRRSLYVSLTDAGRGAALSMERVFMEADRRAALELPECEETRLKELLVSVYRSMMKEEARA